MQAATAVDKFGHTDLVFRSEAGGFHSEPVLVKSMMQYLISEAICKR